MTQSGRERGLQIRDAIWGREEVSRNMHTVCVLLACLLACLPSMYVFAFVSWGAAVGEETKERDSTYRLDLG